MDDIEDFGEPDREKPTCEGMTLPEEPVDEPTYDPVAKRWLTPKDLRSTVGGENHAIRKLLEEHGFDPNAPTISDEDQKRMPPPTPRIAPYDSDRN
jgi:hypothetical protein